ncbi:hypothetical protein ACJEJG_25160, partial [Escherichia coli]
TVCVVGKMRDLILQLSKSSIYSTKPCLLLFLPQKNLSIFLSISEILIKVTIMSMPLSNALQS